MTSMVISRQGHSSGRLGTLAVPDLSAVLLEEVNGRNLEEILDVVKQEAGVVANETLETHKLRVPDVTSSTYMCAAVDQNNLMTSRLPVEYPPRRQTIKSLRQHIETGQTVNSTSNNGQLSVTYPTIGKIDEDILLDNISRVLKVSIPELIASATQTLDEPDSFMYDLRKTERGHMTTNSVTCTLLASGGNVTEIGREPRNNITSQNCHMQSDQIVHVPFSDKQFDTPVTTPDWHRPVSPNHMIMDCTSNWSDCSVAPSVDPFSPYSGPYANSPQSSGEVSSAHSTDVEMKFLDHGALFNNADEQPSEARRLSNHRLVMNGFGSPDPMESTAVVTYAEKSKSPSPKRRRTQRRVHVKCRTTANNKASTAPNFLLSLLRSKLHNPHVIYWVDRQKGVFKLADSKAVAAMWAQARTRMGCRRTSNTYENFSRTIRHHYKKKEILAVEGRRLTYQFGPNGPEWVDDAKERPV